MPVANQMPTKIPVTNLVLNSHCQLVPVINSIPTHMPASNSMPTQMSVPYRSNDNKDARWVTTNKANSNTDVSNKFNAYDTDSNNTCKSNVNIDSSNKSNCNTNVSLNKPNPTLIFYILKMQVTNQMPTQLPKKNSMQTQMLVYTEVIANAKCQFLHSCLG
jgi:hypothetical protein